MVVYQLDACTYCPDGLKTKIRGCLNVRIGLGELVSAQLVIPLDVAIPGN